MKCMLVWFLCVAATFGLFGGIPELCRLADIPPLIESYDFPDPVRADGERPEAIVTFIVVINEEGRIVDPEWLQPEQSVSYPGLIGALSHFHFEPAIWSGAKIPLLVRLSFWFAEGAEYPESLVVWQNECFDRPALLRPNARFWEGLQEASAFSGSVYGYRHYADGETRWMLGPEDELRREYGWNRTIQGLRRLSALAAADNRVAVGSYQWVQPHFRREDRPPLLYSVSMADLDREPGLKLSRLKDFFIPGVGRRSGSMTLVLQSDERGRVITAAISATQFPEMIEETLWNIKRRPLEPAEIRGESVPAMLYVHLINQAGRSRFPGLRTEDSTFFTARPQHYVLPVLTAEQIENRVDFEVNCNIVVDGRGRLVSYDILDEVDPQVAQQTGAALQACRFFPGYFGSINSTSQFALPIKFVYEHRSRTFRDLQKRLERGKITILEETDLRVPLTPIWMIPPEYPIQQLRYGETGEAEIEFYVAEQGGVYFPKIIHATKPEFGWSAAQALQYSRFAPPGTDGRTLIRVRRTISFDPDAEVRSPIQFDQL